MPMLCYVMVQFHIMDVFCRFGHKCCEISKIEAQPMLRQA